MRWDQIRYPDPAKNPDLEETDQGNAILDRLDALNFPEDSTLEVDQMVGHYVEDVKEGYEFRLDPLLVDGLEGPDFPFGGQTHPSSKLHPNVSEVMEWNEISVVRLTGAVEVVATPGDCSGDGTLSAADLACVTSTADRDLVLGALNSLPGDLDGADGVGFPDFLILSSNFGTDKTAYTDGSIDLDGGVGFPDFLVLSANFGQTAAASLAVPEPASLTLISIGGLLLGFASRRRREL